MLLYLYQANFTTPKPTFILNYVMKSFATLAAMLLAPLGLVAQTTPVKPAPKAAPAATSSTTSAAPAQAAPAPLALAPVTPAPDPNALKIKVDQNPIAHTLTVRCDAPGPTRFEINDQEGRPVITKTSMVGTTPTVLKVGTLPAGPYVVRCTAGEKRGTKLVQIQ